MRLFALSSHTNFRLALAVSGLAFIGGSVGCSAPMDLTVIALDANSAPIPAASLEVLGEGLKANFDPNGQVVLKTLRFSGSRGIKITAAGYETMYRNVTLRPGSENELSVRLRPAPAPHHVTVPQADAATLSIDEGIARVSIKPGGLVHKDGSTVTGDVDVLIIPFDPVSREDAPAQLDVVDGHRLISLGMSTITITQAGEPAPGVPLEWSMTVNPAMAPFADVSYYRLFSVDETKGIWVPEPTATLAWDPAEARFTGQLPHLSVWNCDYAWMAGACVTGQVLDAHNQIVTDPGVKISAQDTSGGISVDNTSAAFTTSSFLNVASPQYLGHLFIGSFSDPFYVNYGAQLPADYYDDRYDRRNGGGRNNNVRPRAFGGLAPEDVPGLGVVQQADSYTTIAQTPISVPSPGGYFIPIPKITPDFQWLVARYGLDQLPIQISLSGVSLPNQQLYQVTKNGGLVAASLTQGPLTPGAWSCDTINFQYCYADGAACASGDVCCNGQACNSEGHCGPGTPVTPVTPTTPACTALGGTCSASSQCCGGQPCNSTGHCGPEQPQCRQLAQSCNNLYDCCPGTRFCENGTCANCIPSHGYGCNNAADCCSGSCVNNYCLDCQDQGAGCNSSGQCCSGNVCVKPAPGNAAAGSDNTCQACIPDGHGTCSSAADCCDGASCNNGVCHHCAPNAGSCNNAGDCCAGMCIQNMCTTCVPAEQPCSLGACCGGLQCAFDQKCRACEATGVACTQGIDCCSGSCQDHLCL